MSGAKGWRLEASYQATRAESVRVQRNAAIAVAESGVVIRSQGAGRVYVADTAPERPGLSWSLRFTASEEEARSLLAAIIRCFRSECDVDVEVRLSKDADPITA